MALGFGRKKAAPDAQIDPENIAETTQNVAPPEQSADDLGAFDLDAFADSMESGDATTHPSPLANDLIAPAAQIDAPDIVPSTQGSAFDFPEPSHTPLVESTGESQILDFNQTFAAEQQEAIASGKIVPPPVEIEAPPETGLYAPQIAVEKPQKKLPLVPIIGALLALGVAGAAATFLTRGNTEEETPVAPPMPSRAREVAPAPVAPPANANVASPEPQPEPNTAPPPLSPEMKTRLKALWQQGAEAKHRGDNDAARRIWQQGLQVQPGNRGFLESIAKLPK